MKRIALYASTAVALGLGLTSCDEVTEPITGECNSYSVTEQSNTKMISGIICEDFTMDANTDWVLSGGVFVDEGVTLTIEAGTTIKSETNGANTAFLSVLRGGKIMADGTANAPIIMTSGESNPAAGDWGGIIINGKAPINTGLEATGEGNTGIYGGTDASDNSGVLRYVRVEYAGRILGTDNELNGFSFNGVGNGTTVEYIQAYEGADDGIEFFGGTVNVRYAISTHNEDDSFDWTQGWSGKGQFWVVQQGANGGDRAIEADNNGDNNAATPFSNPMLANLTLIGVNDGDDSNQGMKLRQGTKGDIYNAIVTGFPKRGVQVEHDQCILNVNDASLTFNTSIVDNVNSFVYSKSEDENGNEVDPSIQLDATKAFDVNGGNQSAEDGSLVGFLNGFVGTSANGATDPSTIDSWFISANYIGAVPSTSNWTANWIK